MAYPPSHRVPLRKLPPVPPYSSHEPACGIHTGAGSCDCPTVIPIATDDQWDRFNR